jgi:hypothetical protein
MHDLPGDGHVIAADELNPLDVSHSRYPHRAGFSTDTAYAASSDPTVVLNSSIRKGFGS